MTKRQKKDKVPKPDTDAGKAGIDRELATDEAADLPAGNQQAVIASARNIPRAGTVLPVPPKGEIGKVRVSLVGDPEFAPNLEEVQKINQRKDSPARTPLMTVIEAVLANEGGSMTLQQISERVPRYWNRPFPTSPYRVEEFLYIMVTRSDNLRVN